MLADNPKGIAIVKDELDGWVLGMNQYRSGGKGNDRQFWLSAWAGSSAKYNRKGSHADGPVVHDPFVAVTGMMTPASLPNIRGGWRKGEATAEDGFPDRFLWSFPDPPPATGERWCEVPEALTNGYAEVMTNLLAMDMVTETQGLETRQRPIIVTMNDDAKDAYQQFTQAIADRMNTLDPFEHYRGVLSKLRGYRGRLAILLWCARQAGDEWRQSTHIDAATINNAAALVDHFEGHARRCLGSGWADKKHRVGKRLLAWLMRNPDKKTFTRSEAFLQLKDRRDVTAGDDMDNPLRMLTDYGYIRPGDPYGYSRPGPRPELFVVNLATPALPEVTRWPSTCQTLETPRSLPRRRRVGNRVLRLSGFSLSSRPFVMLLIWFSPKNRKYFTQGSRTKAVICEKCGQHYEYEIRREAEGIDNSLFSWNECDAFRKAEVNANKNLDKKLDAEEDVAPCPACDWVQMNMIAAVRKQSHLELRRISSAIMILGSVVFAFSFLYTLGICFSVKDSEVLTKKLLGVGQFILIVIGIFGLPSGLLLGLRHLLNSSWDPNRAQRQKV